MGCGVQGGSVSLCGIPRAWSCFPGKHDIALFRFGKETGFSLEPSAEMEAADLTRLRFQTLPTLLMTPSPRPQWIACPSFYHPAYLIFVEDEWLWLKKLNNGKSKVQHRVNLTRLQTFLSLSCFWDQAWISLPAAHICWNSFNHWCFFLEIWN